MVDRESIGFMLLIGRYMFRIKEYACATLQHLEWKLGESLKKSRKALSTEKSKEKLSHDVRGRSSTAGRGRYARSRNII